jgi:PST family polysaccharide transporter
MTSVEAVVPKRNLRLRTVHGALWTFAQRFAGEAISLAVFFVLARILDPASFGVVGLASVYIALGDVLAEQGIGTALIQKAELTAAHVDTAFVMSVVGGLGLTLAGVLAAHPMAALVRQPAVAEILQWLSLQFTFNALGRVPDAMLRRHLRFRTTAVRLLVARSTAGIIAVVLAFLGAGVWSLVVLQLTTSLVGALVLWMVVDHRPRFHFDRRYYADLATFGGNVLGTSLTTFMARRSDDFLIGTFLGPAALGLYTAAYRVLMSLTNLLTNAISQVVYPAFARIQDQPERVAKAFGDATYYTTLVSIPVFLGCAIMAPELTQVAFGPQWLGSAPVLRILCLSGFPQTQVFMAGAVMLGVGRADWRFRLSVASAVGTVLMFMLTVRYGVVAVAAGFAVSQALLVPVSLLLVRRLVPIGMDYARRFVVPCVGACVMALAMVAVRTTVIFPNPAANLLIPSLSGGAAYFLITWALDRGTIRLAWSGSRNLVNAYRAKS